MILFNKQKITLLDIILFLHQVRALLTAGLSIIQALELLEYGQVKIKLRLMIYFIKQEIFRGKTFSQALRKFPAYYNDLVCHLIKIGEHTGQLEIMLSHVIELKEKQLAFQSRIKQVLFYPSVMLVIAGLVFLILCLVVIPKFAELFQDQVALPFLTTLIFTFALHIKKMLPMIFGFALISIIGIYQYVKNAPKKEKFLARCCELPWIKTWYHQMTIVRFIRTLAITLAAGIPILEALDLSAKSTGNVKINAVTVLLKNNINTGKKLYLAMTESHYFPHLLLQMVRIGEESGKLDLMLNQSALFIETRLNERMKTLNQLLEPLIMVGLGVLIGGLVIGMYLPIFKLGNVF